MRPFRVAIFTFAFMAPSFLLGKELKYCPKSAAGVMQLEESILQSSDVQVSGGSLQPQVLRDLECLIHVFKTQKGLTRQVAHTSLVTLYGRARNPKYAYDPRFQLVAKALVRESLISSAVRQLVLGGYSQGMEEAYKLFCGEESREHCVDMLPQADLIQNQSELVSAGNIYFLKDTYEKVDSNQKKKIRVLIRDLYQRIPKNEGIKSLVIQEVYRSFFGQEPNLDLSQA